MTARYSRLATASTVTVEHMLDAEASVKRIKQALADGLQPHDVPEILAACAAVEEHAAGIREQMAEIADVELDIDAVRRVLTVGREDVWDRRYQARDKRVRQMKAPTRLHPVEAGENEDQSEVA